MELLTAQEAADFLELKEGTFRYYVKIGMINQVSQTIVSGRTPLFKKSDVEELRAKRVFASNDTPTKRFLYRSNAYKNKVICEDQAFDNGCIIYWSKRFREHGNTYIPMKCRDCGKIVNRLPQHIYESLRNGTFTGCCSLCSPGHRKNQLLPRDG